MFGCTVYAFIICRGDGLKVWEGVPYPDHMRTARGGLMRGFPGRVSGAGLGRDAWVFWTDSGNLRRAVSVFSVQILWGRRYQACRPLYRHSGCGGRFIDNFFRAVGGCRAGGSGAWKKGGAPGKALAAYGVCSADQKSALSGSISRLGGKGRAHASGAVAVWRILSVPDPVFAGVRRTLFKTACPGGKGEDT